MRERLDGNRLGSDLSRFNPRVRIPGPSCLAASRDPDAYPGRRSSRTAPPTVRCPRASRPFARSARPPGSRSGRRLAGQPPSPGFSQQLALQRELAQELVLLAPQPARLAFEPADPLRRVAVDGRVAPPPVVVRAFRNPVLGQDRRQRPLATANLRQQGPDEIVRISPSSHTPSENPLDDRAAGAGPSSCRSVPGRPSRSPWPSRPSPEGHETLPSSWRPPWNGTALHELSRHPPFERLPCDVAPVFPQVTVVGSLAATTLLEVANVRGITSRTPTPELRRSHVRSRRGRRSDV